MNTKRLRLNSKDDGATIAEAARCLAAGGLVAFPTETVYGLGANADDPKAMAKLRRVKARDGNKPFTIHIADWSDLARYARRTSAPARKLIEKYWPGPLTVVFPGDGGRGIGVRFPAHEVARAIIRGAGVAVVLPSANRGGEPPASNAAEVEHTLGGEIDLIVDGGPATLGESSTVVSFAHGRIEVLREGIISEQAVRDTARTVILFVCTANSCRSPIAEALCRMMLAGRLGVAPDDLDETGYEVASAGVSGGFGAASDEAMVAAAHLGADLSGHRARALTREMLADADMVFAMTQSHVDGVVAMDPDSAPRVKLLDPRGRDIEDPMGGGREEFRVCASRIRQCLKQIVETL